MEYDFLVDTYETERLKILSVWSTFTDEDLSNSTTVVGQKRQKRTGHRTHFYKVKRVDIEHLRHERRRPPPACHGNAS